ncbi:MAG: hypothetical protein J4F39_01815 [Candidatus Latescibacteria bacterium]|nr:hypothetical protein [Candidatus Latescibacterota bacterium]
MRRVKPISIVVALLLMSCGEDNPLNYDTLAGTYTLREIQLTGGSQTQTLRPPEATGTLVLSTTGDFSMSLSVPSLQMVDRYSDGTYAIEGSSILFQEAATLGLVGTNAAVSGNELTLTSSIGESQVTMVFVKV